MPSFGGKHAPDQPARITIAGRPGDGLLVEITNPVAVSVPALDAIPGAGVGLVGLRERVVCAPFGLADLFAMVARANNTIVTIQVFEEKVARWAAQWPQLTVIPW